MRLVRAWRPVLAQAEVVLAEDVRSLAQQLLGLTGLGGEAGVAGGPQVGGQVADQVREQLRRGPLPQCLFRISVSE
ncbi:hypothetical protein ACWC5I_48835 [Kitasatospora sp. NPDC001574]